MRITTSFQYVRFLDSLRSLRERIATSHERLGSGRRLASPSDDPAAASESLLLRSRLAALDRFASNTSAARGFLAVTDSALSSVTNVLVRAREAAIRGASDTSAGARAEIATEIDAIREELLSVARTRYLGRYVFSGTDTQTDPYDDSGIYQGNGAEILVESGDSETTALNVDGERVFGAGTGVFGVLEDLADALRSDDRVAVQAAADALETSRDGVSDARTVVGTRLSRLDASLSRHAGARVEVLGRLSDLEDADVVEEITRLSNERVAEQALLATGARIASRSLFDFIR